MSESLKAEIDEWQSLGNGRPFDVPIRRKRIDERPVTLFWVEIPARGGHAQAGRRPAIIAQASSPLPTVLIIPLTSQLDALRFPARFSLKPANKMDSAIIQFALVFQLTAVDKRFISDRLGQVSGQVMQDLWEAFDSLAGRTMK